jgi:hypothetical protein
VGPGQLDSGKDQPHVLVVQNATTNGQRPITYRFEVSADADFNNKVATREGVEPGGDGKTSYRLPDALAPDRTYFWRAKAVDGANESAYSQAVAFSVVTVVEIQPPVPLAPISGATTSSGSPDSGCTRAVGPGRCDFIHFEIARPVVCGYGRGCDHRQQSAETKFTIAQQLKASTKYYRRVRASIRTRRALVADASLVARGPNHPAADDAEPRSACNSSNPV